MPYSYWNFPNADFDSHRPLRFRSVWYIYCWWNITDSQYMEILLGWGMGCPLWVQFFIYILSDIAVMFFVSKQQTLLKCTNSSISNYIYINFSYYKTNWVHKWLSTDNLIPCPTLSIYILLRPSLSITLCILMSTDRFECLWKLYPTCQLLILFMITPKACERN